MNEQTVDLIERPYQDIIDDILTAIIGGVVNEPIIFDLNTLRYSLAEAAQDVRKITGSAKGNKNYSFQKEIDFTFNSNSNLVIWLNGGVWPDDGTTFYVDYARKVSKSPLTDINVGSVSRTLSEAIGREIATVYQQINQAYLSAFVDTAQGKSLDLVVAILGITRLTKEYSQGQVTFFRDPAIEGNITIETGTLVATKDGIVFQTVQQSTLQRGQIRINVNIRATDNFKGDAGKVGSGAITALVQPIAGISRVTNFDATFLGANDETDDELRSRAKAVLQAAGAGTVAALKQAVFEERASLSEVRDPNGPPDKTSDPGTVVLLVDTEPERFPGLKARIDERRAAGVFATVIAPYIVFKPKVVAQINKDLNRPPAGVAKIIDDIIAAVQSYTDGVASGNAAMGQDLVKAIAGVKNVTQVTIKDVITWKTDLGKASNDTTVDIVMKAIESSPPGNLDALRNSISQALSSEAPSAIPAGRLIISRDLVSGLSGNPLTDDDIEKGNFQIKTTLDSQKWRLMLDMETADVLLKEVGYA